MILNVIFIIIGTFFRGTELDVRLSVLRTDAYATGTGNCEFRRSDRTRRRLLRSVLPPLGAASDRLLRAGAVADQERTRTAELEARSPRIEQTIVTSFGDTRVDRCTHLPHRADDPRFAGHAAAPARRIPTRRPWATCSATAAGSGGTSSPTSAAPSATTARAAASKPTTATARTNSGPSRCSGYVTQANWRKDFAPMLKGKEYMEANCAQCHTAGELRRHAQRESRPQALLLHELLRLPQDRRHERRHARARPDGSRQEVQGRLSVGVDRGAARQPRDRLHAQVQSAGGRRHARW